ncbi:MAG: hypothetical protein KGH58_01255 [Candidatus Micrarchaeota archaeon]|nr:hypothetical protein [Candidatus Micrarchaeota archaeon]
MRAQIMAGAAIALLIAAAFCLSLASIGSGAGAAALISQHRMDHMYAINSNGLSALAGQMVMR